ncbi:coiled-coil domain-containing protein 15 isoform X2 [Catharus ustulatus]|uniref:coiled-coil domain-containing protein 15 isoform X2 n=1 Tax=Catharus ustulatus TaxID=91951 RepID=UPI00140C8005|nr:coiled-coil domain-containing protein 15 isoform X2 [Catharus ustulatus]
MCRAWAGALLHLGQCNPLQKSICHPQKCRGSAPAARSMQLFAKMHTSLAKMQGVGGRSRQPLAKLCHCPAKAAWGVRDASARISAVFGKDTSIPPKMVGGRILYPIPISTGCRQSPLRCKTASRESVHVHCSSSLVVSQKRQGKKCKNMIFWRRELVKTFSLSKTPQNSLSSHPRGPVHEPPIRIPSLTANKPHIEEESRVGKPAGLSEAGARKALNKPEKSWDLLGRARGGAGMGLPSKGQRRGAAQPPGRHQARPLQSRWRVLAERNQSVAPVGVWVESAPGQQSPAFASAFRVEEELKEQQQRKAASLRRFQVEVRQRVNWHVRMRRRQELQKAYEAVERESCVTAQYSSPWKNTCVFQSLPAPIICGPSAGSGPAQPEEEHGEPFQQQAAELSRAVQQVRRRLASRRTVSVSPGARRQERQSEFLRCRRLFMALERERVRQQQRQQERQQRVAQIKRQKENQRRAEEQRMRDMAEQREPSPGKGAWEALAQLQLEERRVRDRQQRDKEHTSSESPDEGESQIL